MSTNTATIEHDVAPQSTNMDIQHMGDVSEKKTELDTRDAVNKTEDQTVDEAEPESDAPPPNGGAKAWLYVLAAFFIFISAW